MLRADAHAAGNADPVNKLDPDGKKVVFSDNCSDGFKKRFAESVKYMNKTGTSWYKPEELSRAMREHNDIVQWSI